MADKKTKKDLFNELLALASTDEQKEFINHELELLAKKHDNKKPTKAQEENATLKVAIINELEALGKAVTITELTHMDSFAGYSNQKISALLKQLVDGDVVKREEIKRVAYFSIA